MARNRTNFTRDMANRADEITHLLFSRVLPTETLQSNKMRMSLSTNYVDALIVISKMHEGVDHQTRHMAYSSAVSDIAEASRMQLAYEGAEMPSIIFFWAVACDMCERMSNYTDHDEHVSTAIMRKRPETVRRMADCIAAMLPGDVVEEFIDRLKGPGRDELFKPEDDAPTH